ncbi:hypothetical protein EJ04DRAFT_531726 [Polyplosphaeria fusca]|uniref:Pleckstrin homology domain-containing protein n=1 Tax=Polyplosphaeria fusca TaxID=682080 RepID=A0A9P4V4E3_9PLEO|nr:hypothetical protein EJ04DRAFT_531726 [Polyplosphaeria fusca]
MANDYFSNDDTFVGNHPLPTPADTPYGSVSRRTSRYGTPMTDTGSPPPFPPEPSMNSESNGNDEDMSILDPRRFTPTLHASLVSEILALRRELDSKHKFIEDLETNVHTVRNENDSLTSQLSSSTKESRAVKRQLQQLEHGTLSALEEIAGERDKIKEANADLKQRLETSQKKLRSQEEDSTRVHDMWAREKEAWDGEKRSLERRVHVSESRLKLLLDELAAQEAELEEAAPDSEGEDARDVPMGPESDAGSVRSSPVRRPSTRIARHSRNLSNGSYRSIGRGYRMSLMSGVGSEGHGRHNGLSLADELVFDEEEEDLGELELDSDDFPENEMRARRALESRQSMHQDEKAKRILGLSFENQQANKDGFPTPADAEAQPKVSGSTVRSSVTVTPHEVTLVFPPSKPQYVDTGVQPSPPPSPVRPQSSESVMLKARESTSSIAEVEANQSRKRVSQSPSGLVLQQAQPSQPAQAPCLMTSTSSQTIEQPLSPPATPKITIPVPETPISPVFKPEVVSVSTQTETVEEPAVRLSPPKRAPPPIPISVPSIAIHAPTSAPSSPKEPILPPHTKSVSTQTSSGLASSMRSTGMQTEAIRFDKRPVKLPPHLLPSAISSKPGTPEPVKDESAAGSVIRKDSHHPIPKGGERSTAVPSARQDLMSILEKSSGKSERKVEDRYPGNNDNGPLGSDKENGISRPFRTSSLFAGFDGPSSDEEDVDAEASDDEYKAPQFSTPMLSSRASKHGRVFHNPPTPVPEDKEVVSGPRRSEDSMASGRPTLSSRNSMEKPAKVGKAMRNSIGRQPSIRRSAMIQNGTAAHIRSRSPSLGSVGSSNYNYSYNYVPRPPFPVPTRSSSRKLPISKSEGSQSPTPRGGGGGGGGNGAFPGRRPYGSRQHQRKDSLRKVRSAAVMQKPAGRSRSRSPPLPLPATPVMPPSPQLPPLPTDLVTANNQPWRRGHSHQLSTTTQHTGSNSVGSIGQTGVVDAIAATMVGEWMWKYVRKRKTFGGPDSPADLAREDAAIMSGNGVRHKRWVWISPYERSVLWSSKQPTSSSALIGKSGRKLIIQSVLDVADNTPIPRNAGAQALFNRSILILTPARALKFTAISRERHYLWLTALSFLAHSSSPIPDLGPMPPAPPPVEELPNRSAGATLRKSHVRDSVRLAKDKANPGAQRFPTARGEPMPDYFSRPGFDKPVSDIAEAPSIPRGPHHGRKRSSTGPGAPPPSVPYRSFSHQHVPSIYSTGSSDVYNMPPSVPSSVYNPHSVMASSRTSEASTSTRQHFFDTMGTVRMEAFIENALGEDGSGKYSGYPAAKPRIGRRRGNSQWSSSTNEAHRAGGIYEDFSHESNDPFRGF